MGQSSERSIDRRSFFLAAAAFLSGTACTSDARSADNPASPGAKRRDLARSGWLTSPIQDRE